MSFLSEEIERQMNARNLSQVQVAAASGLSQPQLSKWIRSEQVGICEEQLNALAPALSECRVDNARLVRAHLLDEKFGPGHELVIVEIDPKKSAPDSKRGVSRGDRAMSYLEGLRHESPTVNTLIVDWAVALGADLK